MNHIDKLAWIRKSTNVMTYHVHPRDHSPCHQRMPSANATKINTTGKSIRVRKAAPSVAPPNIPQIGMVDDLSHKC